MVDWWCLIGRSFLNARLLISWHAGVIGELICTFTHTSTFVTSVSWLCAVPPPTNYYTYYPNKGLKILKMDCGSFLQLDCGPVNARCGRHMEGASGNISQHPICALSLCAGVWKSVNWDTASEKREWRISPSTFVTAVRNKWWSTTFRVREKWFAITYNHRMSSFHFSAPLIVHSMDVWQ